MYLNCSRHFITNDESRCKYGKCPERRQTAVPPHHVDKGRWCSKGKGKYCWSIESRVCLRVKRVLNSHVDNESHEMVASWFRTSVFPWCLSVFLCGTSTFCHLSGTLCLCCGMKGSIVWKRCVWNPCCLEQVRGRRVRKRTSFYSWHGSVRNATLGRRHPPSLIL